MSFPRIVALQMCSTMDPEVNFLVLENSLQEAAFSSPTLVCLPETWLAFMQNGEQSLLFAKQYETWVERLATLCKVHKVWLSAGTMAVQGENGRYYAASYLFNDEGEVVARYNKIHLFDAEIADGSSGYRESRFTIAGSDIVVVDSPFGKIGLSVCYDVRFTGLYQKMRQLGAQLLLVPSAFTTVTGAAHWQPLLRARAIENQCYVVAAAQCGEHENGRKTYGHSLILSPWGEIMADAQTNLGMISTYIDLAQLEQIRADMPIQAHNRFKSEFYE